MLFLKWPPTGVLKCCAVQRSCEQEHCDMLYRENTCWKSSIHTSACVHTYAHTLIVAIAQTSISRLNSPEKPPLSGRLPGIVEKGEAIETFNPKPPRGVPSPDTHRWIIQLVRLSQAAQAPPWSPETAVPLNRDSQTLPGSSRTVKHQHPRALPSASLLPGSVTV